jgi:hypothetical protein
VPTPMVAASAIRRRWQRRHSVSAHMTEDACQRLVEGGGGRVVHVGAERGMV